MIVQSQSTGLNSLEYKGVIDASTEPNYPNAIIGDLYKISVAGKIGGSSGISVEVGDAVYCLVDNAGGTQASVGGSWSIMQANIVNAVSGSGVATVDGEYPLYSGTTGNIIKSSGDQKPGLNWTIRQSAADIDYRSICYGNGLFVAVAISGSGNRISTSPDGINWTSRTSPADNSWLSVCYGNGMFVAVSITGTGNRIMTSQDGKNWTSRTSPADNSWHGVAYGNSTFVAVAITGTGNRVMSSIDGVTWTLRTSAADQAWRHVCFGNGLFIAVSSDGVGSRVMTSPDGITWTLRTTPADNDWRAVHYANGQYVACATTGTLNRVMTSPDGINWSLQTTQNLDFYSVTYGKGLWVLAAATGIGSRIMTSPDGVTWTLRTVPADNNWRSICYANGIFVAVAYSGTGNRVMTSGKIDEYLINNSNCVPGLFGIGCTPTKTLAINGQRAQTVGIERNTVSDTAGTDGDWTISGGATSGATNKNSGVGRLKPGTSTSQGMGSLRLQFLSRALASGTTDNSYFDGLIIPSKKQLTNNSVIGLFEITLASSVLSGGHVFYAIHASNDAGDFCVHSGQLQWQAINKAGTISSSFGHASAASGLETDLSSAAGKKIIDTWSITNGTGKITVNLNANCDLTGTITEIYVIYQVINNGLTPFVQL